jgi:hypothetical protein
MDPHKPTTDSTDLLRGIYEAQLSSDSTALITVLRDAAQAEDKSDECHRVPANSQIRWPERRLGLWAARPPIFGADRASR